MLPPPLPTSLPLTPLLSRPGLGGEAEREPQGGLTLPGGICPGRGWVLGPGTQVVPSLSRAKRPPPAGELAVMCGWGTRRPMRDTGPRCFLCSLRDSRGSTEAGERGRDLRGAGPEQRWAGRAGLCFPEAPAPGLRPLRLLAPPRRIQRVHHVQLLCEKTRGFSQFNTPLADNSAQILI